MTSMPDAADEIAREIVTTGTFTCALPIALGETWSTTISGLPLSGIELAIV